MKFQLRRALHARLIAAACVLGLGAMPCLAHEGHAALPTKGAKVVGEKLLLSGAAAKALGVQLAKVELRAMAGHIGSTGTIVLPSHHEGYASTLVAGRVEEVLVHPGDRVTAGQALAHISSAELSNLQMELLQAASELHVAERVLAQKESLAKSGAVPGKERYQAETNHRQKLAALGMARQKLGAIGLSDTQINDVLSTSKPVQSLPLVAPIAGVVSVADARVGQFVEPNQHLYHLIDNSHVWLLGHVLESDAAFVAPNSAVDVNLPALPGGSLRGRVLRFAAQVDIEQGTLPVLVEVDNANDRLRAGMFARLTIETHRVPQAIVCPSAALVRSKSGTFALVEELRGVLARKRVEVGLRQGDLVEVVDGLFPGDMVVTTGSHELASLFGALPDEESRSLSVFSEPFGRAGTAGQPVSILARLELPTEQKYAVAPAVEGRLVALHVERSERVEAGQLLAEVSSLPLSNLELEFLLAVSEERQASWTLERLGHLQAGRIISQQEFWDAESGRQIAGNAVAGLRYRLALVGRSPKRLAELEHVDLATFAEQTVTNTTLELRAPHAGWLGDVDLALGQVVDASRAMFVIHDTSTMWARGIVPEQDAPRVAIGAKVRVSIAVDQEFQAVAEIVRVSPLRSGPTRGLAVWVELDNAEGRLCEGMSARLTIEPLATTLPVATR